MNRTLFTSMLGVSTAMALVQATPALAQTTPGDQSGTAASAGAGQSAASSTSAPAQPAPRAAAAGNDSGDIIVTARRVDERLQDVPISITVFNQQQITNRNLVNASDLATYTPSLSTNNNFGTEFSSYAIRGFVQDPLTSPSVGVYFADVVALRGPSQGSQSGDGAGPGNFFDLQNVQVLKGPQGTLFGRNTTGGAVLFVPQKPTGRTEGYLEGSYGNFDMKRVQGAVNLPISDTARFRIAGDYLNRDGYLNNRSGVGPAHYNDVNYFAIRASLVIDLTPDLENYTIASVLHSKTNGSTQKQIFCVPSSGLGALFACPQQQREAAAGYGFYDVDAPLNNPTSRLDTWQLINTTTWRASDTLTIKNIISYGQYVASQRAPLFASDWRLPNPPFPAVLAGSNIAGVGVISPAPGYDNVAQSTFTEELQVQGKALDDKLVYQFGGYLEVSDPLRNSGVLSPVLVGCTDSAAIAAFRCTNPIGAGAVNYIVGTTSFQDYAGYAQATYALTEKLKVTGGVRYTHDKEVNDTVKVTYVPNGFAIDPVRAICTEALTTLYNGNNCRGIAKQVSHKPTWIADIEYKPVDDLLLYAKYSRGYRAGGVAVNSPLNLRVFQPEKVDVYEGGMKATFHGAVNGTFNVTGFYNNFSNQQVQAGFFAAGNTPVSPTAGPVNIGKSRIYGAEVETSISPFRGFTIDGSYTYLNTKITQVPTIVSTDPAYAIGVSIQPGNPLRLSPKNKFSIAGHYQLPLDSSIGRISFGGTFTHSDKQLTTYEYINTPAVQASVAAQGYGNDPGTIQAINLLSLDAQWRGIFGTPIDVSAFATNVTQKHYLSYVPGLAGAGFESAVLGEPRMYGVRVRYNFGR